MGSRGKHIQLKNGQLNGRVGKGAVEVPAVSPTAISSLVEPETGTRPVFSETTSAARHNQEIAQPWKDARNFDDVAEYFAQKSDDEGWNEDDSEYAALGVLNTLPIDVSRDSDDGLRVRSYIAYGGPTTILETRTSDGTVRLITEWGGNTDEVVIDNEVLASQMVDRYQEFLPGAFNGR